MISREPSAGAGGPRRGPALALLRLLILAYRRWCSGRGPLRRVGCSFVETESCSAYGLRMAETAPNALVASARIRGRLRRCRELSVYRARVDGREALLWGCGHDEPAALAAALEAVDELPATRVAVLDASRWICAHRGRWPLAIELDGDIEAAIAELSEARAAEPAGQGPSVFSPTRRPRPRLLLRRGERLLAGLSRRAAIQVGVLVALALAWAALARGLDLPWPLLALGVLACTASAARVLVVVARRRQRFARLLGASAFATAGRVELRPATGVGSSTA